jgi:hypothetical protein
MIADRLLTRLSSFKQTGDGRWQRRHTGRSDCMTLPPYGRQIAATKPRDVRIYTGIYGWDSARSFQQLNGIGVTCLPPGESPDSLTWPVAGADVTILDDGTTERDTLHDLAVTVIQSGALMAIIIQTCWHPAPLYRRMEAAA